MGQVRAELYKLSSLSLCSNTIGQLATGIMINPPKPGDPSFETFKKVKSGRRMSCIGDRCREACVVLVGKYGCMPAEIECSLPLVKLIIPRLACNTLSEHRT